MFISLHDVCRKCMLLCVIFCCNASCSVQSTSKLLSSVNERSFVSWPCSEASLALKLYIYWCHGVIRLFA